MGVENSDTLIKFIKAKSVGVTKEKSPKETKPPTFDLKSCTEEPIVTPHMASASGSDTPKYSGTYHFPKLPSFYGEENKGEVSWASFKFELKALQAEKVFSEEQILQGIRRALKGNASDIVRRLGIGVSVGEVIVHLR